MNQHLVLQLRNVGTIVSIPRVYSCDRGDHDATTRVHCGDAQSGEMQDCPAAILRMEGGQASVVVTSPLNEQFTINFMTGYVNSAAGQVDAHLEGDTWIVIVNDKERYEVPLAAIEGG
jgi:hypothetical protein